MIKCIKKARKYNIKNRLYLEGKFLNEGGFKIKQHIKYKIDNVKKQVIVSLCDENVVGAKRVAKTTSRIGVTPVIDIKTKDIREFFNSHDNIEVSVFEGKIIFKVKEDIKVKLGKKIVEFKQKIKYYASNMARFSKVVNENQISMFDLFEFDSSEISSSETIEDYLKKKTIKMISLFSGSGMLDKGFLDNGKYDIKFACDMTTPIEYDGNGKRKRPANDLGSYHIDTYRHNIGNHIIDRDILTLQEEDVPEADFVCGGVPCTKFSKLNTSEKSFRKSDTTDFPLLDKFLDVVRWSKAKAFLIENVVDFVKSKGGAMFNKLKSIMSDFNITYKVINSKDLGSAQSRSRVFIFGMKEKNPEIKLPNLVKVRTVKDAFENIENAPQHDMYGEIKEGSKAFERAKFVPEGGNISDVPEYLRPPKKKFNDYCIRLSREQHSPTIVHIGDHVIMPPSENRKLSVREGARLFSLPDNFIFKGSITSIYEQLKNGVDYKVSSFLAKIIAEQLQPIL